MKLADFHPDAAHKAKQAALRYEQIRLGLGIDFRNELSAALLRIRENPLMYAAELGAIRMVPLHRFPYSIVYEDFPDRV